jgi:glutamate-1-semialdehyde 2,1-aminomutase
MTGFRVALGGAQALYDVCPDLTTFGKIIGGGMPVGAFGGRRDVMSYLAPLGTVYQAGTLSGNPLAMTAGLIGLELLERPGFYEQLYQRTEALMTGLATIAARHQIPFSTQYQAGMFGIYFTDAKQIHNLTDVKTSHIKRFNQFFHGMLAEGIYFAPSAYEAGFLSSAHDSDIIDKTLASAEKVMQTLK